jgi:hypothetical protein
MVDENLGFDEADDALPAMEHHSGTQANHSANKSDIQPQAQKKGKTTRRFRKLLDSVDSYGNTVWRVRVQNPLLPIY